MRSPEEIQADINQAVAYNDGDALFRLADEYGDTDVPWIVGSINFARGWAHLSKGDYAAALEHHDRALAAYTSIEDRSNTATTLMTLGSIYQAAGDYPAALVHLHRSLTLNLDLGDRRQAAVAINNIGIVHFTCGDYPMALEHWQRSLAVSEELNDPRGIADATCNIGNVYGSTGDHLKALEYFQRALPLHESYGHRFHAAHDLMNMGDTYSLLQDHTAALEYHERALEIYTDLGASPLVVRSKGLIMADHLHLENINEARSILESMDAAPINDPDVRIEREITRAALHERSHDLDAAVETLKGALVQAKAHGLRPLEIKTHKALRDLHFKQNDLASYVEHNNEFTRITEEINGKDTATKLALQIKQREIDAERKETEKFLAVLHATLPKNIAERIARGEEVSDHYDHAAVLFLDIVGFTTFSDLLPSASVANLLEAIFEALDGVCQHHGVVKIKTIGDSYLAVAFPTESSTPDQTAAGVNMRAAHTALGMLQALEGLTAESTDAVLAGILAQLPDGLSVRIGLHSGPITAGVLGKDRLQYDVWGDTVNVASRMESNGVPGSVSISAEMAAALQDFADFTIESRGTVEVKGKGAMEMYILRSA